MKVLSTSSLPRVCPPPEKAPRGAEPLWTGPALGSISEDQIEEIETYSAARRSRSLTTFPPGTPGLPGFSTDNPLETKFSQKQKDVISPLTSVHRQRTNSGHDHLHLRRRWAMVHEVFAQHRRHRQEWQSAAQGHH